MKINLKKVDQVEILTLQDNCIDFFAFKENNQMIQRPVPIKQTECGLELSTPPGAEHGWSSIISICNSDSTKHLLFDFGWSEHGAARNAELLGIDMNKIDMLALSHGHIDHFGGIKALYDQIKNPGIELVLHPAAFRNPRYGKVMGDKKLYQPCLTKEMLDQVGVTLKQTDKPTQLLERNCLFLTSIERKNSFETGMNDVFYLDAGKEKRDFIDDDASIVVHLKNQGLVIISGCGHAGMINTIEYAQKVTGVEKIHAVIGGFHLTGPEYRHIIKPTIDTLIKINPDYIVPTHCTGRSTIAAIERAMPEKFILNMSGTKLIFTTKGA